MICLLGDKWGDVAATSINTTLKKSSFAEEKSWKRLKETST